MFEHFPPKYKRPLLMWTMCRYRFHDKNPNFAKKKKIMAGTSNSKNFPLLTHKQIGSWTDVFLWIFFLKLNFYKPFLKNILGFWNFRFHNIDNKYVLPCIAVCTFFSAFLYLKKCWTSKCCKQKKISRIAHLLPCMHI